MLILNNNGIYAQSIDGMLFQLTKDDDILEYIHDSISQEGDVTFRELMNILEPFVGDLKAIYKTIINGCNLELFFDEVKKDKENNIEGVEDVKFKWLILTDHEGYFDIVPKIRIAENIQKNILMYRPLTLVPLNDIGDLPVILDESIQFEKPYKRIWNMYDLVESLLFEICIFKTPEDRNTRNKMILKNVEDAETIISFQADTWDDIENGLLIEEADLEIKLRELSEALAIEDYETAAILKSQIDELNFNIDKIKNPTE